MNNDQKPSVVKHVAFCFEKQVSSKMRSILFADIKVTANVADEMPRMRGNH